MANSGSSFNLQALFVDEEELAQRIKKAGESGKNKDEAKRVRDLVTQGIDKLYGQKDAVVLATRDLAKLKLQARRKLMEEGGRNENDHIELNVDMAKEWPQNHQQQILIQAMRRQQAID